MIPGKPKRRRFPISATVDFFFFLFSTISMGNTFHNYKKNWADKRHASHISFNDFAK